MQAISDFLLTLPIGDFVATHDWVWPVCETLHFFGIFKSAATAKLHGLTVATRNVEDFTPKAMSNFDFIVVGAGAAGLPCAIFGARAGARVLLVEKQSGIGGTLHVSSGHLAAGGTKRQK